MAVKQTPLINTPVFFGRSGYGLHFRLYLRNEIRHHLRNTVVFDKFNPFCKILFHLWNSNQFLKLYSFCVIPRYSQNCALFPKRKRVQCSGMVFRYEHGLGVVREVSVSWNWRLSIVFGKHWSVFGCGLGGVCQSEVILICFLIYFCVRHF